MSAIWPDDALIALLHFWAKSEPDGKFTADRETLHQAIGKLREEDMKSFGQMVFRKRFLFDESAILDQALSNLEATGLLERRNESPRYYIVLEALHEAYKQIVANRLEENNIDEENFKKMASLFSEYIKPSA